MTEELIDRRMVIETWRYVAGFTGVYKVSNLGAVFSCRRARLLRPHRDADGYLRIGLWDGKRQRKFAVHRLVAEAFHKDKKNVLHSEVAHLDGNRGNPRADNLKWVSKVENESHKLAHGRHQAGDAAAHRVLTSSQVAEIRLRQGTAKELAARYRVSRHTVYDVWQGVSWSRLKEKEDVRPN